MGVTENEVGLLERSCLFQFYREIDESLHGFDTTKSYFFFYLLYFKTINANN